MEHLLERVLLDPSAEPTNLPMLLLKTITNDFSDGEKIARGGFAAVYKGELQSGTIIAVKKLFNNLDMDEENFIKEVGCLMKAKHTNIVRFLGYSSDTQGKIMTHEGKMIQAEERQRLLCFEFLRKGSLDKYITDVFEGLEWRTRYKIIKGICKGLHYLHHDSDIVHSDLKPANILLDEDMVPKISDFGLARCIDGKQSKAFTSKVLGTLGYLAPESYDGVITSFKSDIYSLGIIITEVLTGRKGYCDIQNVLQSWSIRFKSSQEDDILLEHVRVCAEIGNQCIAANPADRPDTPNIIHRLDEIEHMYGFIETDISPSVPQVHWTAVCGGRWYPSLPWKTIEVFKGSTALQGDTVHRVLLKSTPATPSPLLRVTGGFSETSNLLDVYPLELRFPLEPNKRIKCPVTLTNRTGHYVAAMITPVCQYTRSCVPSSSFHFRKMEPHSTDGIAISIAEEQVLSPQHIGNFQVLMVILASEDGFPSLESFMHTNSMMGMDSNILNSVEESWGEVHQAMLTAIICDKPASFPPAVTSQITTYEAVCDVPGQPKLEEAVFVDVHPTEAWILVGHRGGYVSIWNFQTQERIMALQVTKTSRETTSGAVKFIDREGWFVAGDEEGYVHVYDYITTPGKLITRFQAHGCSHNVYSLAVHPTGPLLLTAASERYIKLWDWAQGWKCTRTFEHFGAFNLKWNPRDTNTFASSFHSKVKIWNIQSSNQITTLDGSGYGDYLYTDGGQHFVIAADRADGANDCARIWDMKEGCIHKLGVRGGGFFNSVACHPTSPLFVSTSLNGLCFWDARTYRLETIVDTNYIVKNVAFVDSKDDTTRLIVEYINGVEIVEINMSTARTDLKTGGGIEGGVDSLQAGYN